MNQIPLDHCALDNNSNVASSLAIAPPATGWWASAPGRVNLIGEHTDYNQGYSLPLAIERYTTVKLQPVSTKSKLEPSASYFYSKTFDQTAVWSCDGVQFIGHCSGSGLPGQGPGIGLTRPGTPQPIDSIPHSLALLDKASDPPIWSKYVAGVLNQFHQRGHLLPSLQIQIDSDVPLGGGVSSSAALEVAVAMAIHKALGLELNGLEIALLCQAAEHEYAGVPCGLMDQMSSVWGRRDHLMLLDCRSNQIEHLELPDDLAVLVVNSHNKHTLADGEYQQRRWQCEEACRCLQIESLREIGMRELNLNRHLLSDALFRRTRHVVSEIGRTVEVAQRIRDRQWAAVGELMYLSHQSMRDDYEITCLEVDQLVEIARDLGTAHGLYGARMTGGGFGGCVIGLVDREQAEVINRNILLEYKKRTGIDADSFLTRPAAGALEY